MSTQPYATLQNIASASWSLMLDSTAGGGAGSGIGRVVQALADIHQCIKIIFGTVPGEDPFRPTFGCDLTQYLDLPLPAAIPALVASVSNAIKMWEPRITVESISAQPNLSSTGQIVVTVVWTPNLGLINQPNAIIGSQTTTLAIGGAA
jgi:uncharacterized protein